MKNIFPIRVLFFFILVCTCLFTVQVVAQDKKVAASGWEGVVVGGYVDDGAFLNFLGPNVSYKKGSSKWMIGMMPSLRFKKDKSTTTVNASVVPALGLGLTYLYKRLAVQLPVYYNAKTASKDGAWVVGAGLGFKLQR
ncbi:MAG: hypothetical protein ACKO1U_06925 [Bacteroidota bacterium]